MRAPPSCGNTCRKAPPSAPGHRVHWYKKHSRNAFLRDRCGRDWESSESDCPRWKARRPADLHRGKRPDSAASVPVSASNPEEVTEVGNHSSCHGKRALNEVTASGPACSGSRIQFDWTLIQIRHQCPHSFLGCRVACSLFFTASASTSVSHGKKKASPVLPRYGLGHPGPLKPNRILCRASLPNAIANAGWMSWFHEAKFGMFIHWGPHSVAGVEASRPRPICCLSRNRELRRTALGAGRAEAGACI